jgi:hypothetical protein
MINSQEQGIGERGYRQEWGGLFRAKWMRKCLLWGRRIEARIEGATTLPEKRVVAS